MMWLKQKWVQLREWSASEPKETRLLSLDGLDMLVLAWGFALAAGGARALAEQTLIAAALWLVAYLLLGFFLLAMYIAIRKVLLTGRSRGQQVLKTLLLLAALTILAANRYL